MNNYLRYITTILTELRRPTSYASRYMYDINIYQDTYIHRLMGVRSGFFNITKSVTNVYGACCCFNITKSVTDVYGGLSTIPVLSNVYASTFDE